ncbi:hypothetical protein SAMN05421807_11668 [Virgibacillus chiguensis]|uniref:Uncharacterized protein n=1 Tax=Virgibacillus chiguensis TaxID=411959 RepID=A0A1M5WHZ9_9BACI|nr:hypothetical protein SAMN05421807_11668 [Virgibacillus chiguensis]
MNGSEFGASTSDLARNGSEFGASTSDLRGTRASSGRARAIFRGTGANLGRAGAIWRGTRASPDEHERIYEERERVRTSTSDFPRNGSEYGRARAHLR